MTTPRQETWFRQALLPTFALLAVPALATGLLLALLREGLALEPLALLARWRWLLAACAAAAGLVVVLFRVRVGPEGLRAFNAWGLYRTVDWKDIEAVQLVSLLGLRYARAEIDKVGGPLWIPLFLARREQFAAMVREYAGADHPLTKTLDGK